MGRIIFIHIILLLIVSPGVMAQRDSSLHLILQKTIAGNFRDFYVDNLGNMYLINPDNRIKKLNAAGDSITVYNDTRRYGDLYSMDVSNPFKEIIFYKDFLTIVVVDKFLNSLNIINLRDYNILQAKAVALSYDNNYWVFDEWSNTLKKIDDNGKLLLESPDFRLAFNEAFIPQKIIDADGILYLYDEKTGWKIFDYYGHFKKNLPFPDWTNVQAMNAKVYGWVNGKLVESAIAFPDIKYDEINFSAITFKKIFRAGKLFYVLNADGLSIYQPE